MDELFPVWRHHAVFTDSPFELVQAEGQHRGHAVVEQVFADVTSGPLAHLPSGHFAANAAWLSIAAMAHNLLRAAGALASLPYAKARAATIRRDLIAVAARTARHGRGHLVLHLPEGWHREQEWMQPVGRGLRPARRSGLTSPEPVTHPHGRRPPRTPAPTQDLGQAAEQASGSTSTPENKPAETKTRNRHARHSLGGSRFLEHVSTQASHFTADRVKTSAGLSNLATLLHAEPPGRIRHDRSSD